MYTLNHQIQKALHIAEQETKASVGVICDWKQAKHTLEMLLSTGQLQGVMKHQTRTYVATTGSTVRFIGNSAEEVAQACAGMQFSHIFVREVADLASRSYINSRLRSTESFTEPMGIYSEFGVTRTEGY